MAKRRVSLPMQQQDPAHARFLIKNLYPLLILGCFLTLLGVLTPDAQAEPSLNILKVDTSAVEQEPVERDNFKAKVRLYFTADDEDGKPIPSTSDNYTVTIEKQPIKISNSELLEFSDGDMTIAVMVVLSGNEGALLVEDADGLDTRKLLFEKMLSKFRRKDELGVYFYGDNINDSQVLDLKVNGVKDYAKGIPTLNANEGTAPNAYDAVNTAALSLEQSKADMKYLLLITDGQGKTLAKGTKERRATIAFRDEAVDAMSDFNVTPIVIYYPIDNGKYNRSSDLQTLVKNGGLFFAPSSPKKYEDALVASYDYIFSRHHILEVTFDLNDEWIEAGKKTFVLNAEFESGSPDTAKGSADWPKLSKSYWWILWWTLGIIFGLLFIWLIIVLIKKWKNRPVPEVIEEEEVFAEEGPNEVFCNVCGKMVPKLLYGFTGEFCLEGGQPDCEYYQPPNRGHLEVIKGGELTGVTFFIKDEITTIGSLVSENTSVLVRDPSVSKKHAAIKLDEGNRYELRDFASTNGTFVNGDRIQRKFLKDGDRLSVGKVDMEFVLKG